MGRGRFGGAGPVLVGVQAGSDEEVSDWAGALGGCPARFRLGCRRIGVEHERFLVLWVMRVFLGWGIIGVRTGIWIPYRSRVGVSRLSQASGRLAPLAGSETTRPALGSGGAQPGACMVCPTCYRDSLPGRESQKDGLGTVEREIARKGSPQPEAVPRTRHTQIEQALVERTHRERPLTAVSSTQSAVGKWQYSAPSTQHAVSEGGDTAHAHARNDTPPRRPHPVDDCTGLDARRTHPTGTPRPGQSSRTGSGSGSGSWTPDGPARRTDSTPAPPPTLHAAPTTAAAVAATAQARQPRQPRPRQHATTPATPASVAASLNPDRHGTRPGNTTAKARHRTVAAVCSPTQTDLAPAANPGQPLHLFVAAACSSTDTVPAPASDLGLFPPLRR